MRAALFSKPMPSTYLSPKSPRLRVKVHSPGVITRVSQASSTHSAIAVKGEVTTKAAKPSVVPASPAGRAKRRSGTARAGSATASLLPLEPVSAMAKGEARAITVRIATRRVFFIIFGLRNSSLYVNSPFPGQATFPSPEPAVGFEPTTSGLQNRCSTTELSRPKTYLPPLLSRGKRRPLRGSRKRLARMPKPA